jgi:SAM-dependent methyltransferase
MGELDEAIREHYRQADLGPRILAAAAEAGLDLDTLTAADLAPFDQFHIRGREATCELAGLAGLGHGMRVLDLGCGIGGPARTLASEFGCEVEGVDLVEEYCRAATVLTERVGLGGRVRFRPGDVRALPFESGSFDVVWVQHMMMNLPDKARVLGEVRRVLRAGGGLALHEAAAGTVSPPHFPLPWASDGVIDFLLPPEALRRMLVAVGFTVRVWHDVTGASLAWFRAVKAARAASAAGPAGKRAPGLRVLMGADAGEKVANLVRNLAEDRVRVVLAVAGRADRPVKVSAR